MEGDIQTLQVRHDELSAETARLQDLCEEQREAMELEKAKCEQTLTQLVEEVSLTNTISWQGFFYVTGPRGAKRVVVVSSQ